MKIFRPLSPIVVTALSAASATADLNGKALENAANKIIKRLKAKAALMLDKSEDQIIIADIGHFESEQFTIDLIAEFLRKKFPTFAPCLTGHNTNPVKYF